MIILNTTFVLHPSVAAEALAWVRRAYQESAVKAGATGPMLARVLSAGTDCGESYALHLPFPDMASAQKWNDGVGASLRKIMASRWGEKALPFHTYLEVVE